MSSRSQFPHPFGKVAREFRKARRRFPDEIANIALNEFKENFKRGGYRGDSGQVVKWKPRKTNRRRSDKTRALLVKSARMKRSLRKSSSYDEARVATNVIYAQTHNEGDSDRNIEKRPFMITTKPLLKDIENHIFKRIDKIWRK